MDISDRLDQAMQLRDGMSQSELSRRSTVPQPTINRILKGKTRQPDMPTMQKLCGALEISLQWLSDGIGPSPGDGNKVSDVFGEKGAVQVWDDREELDAEEGRLWMDRYDYHFSAGSGLLQWEVREKKALPFNASFFKAKGLKPRDCRLIVARGDSMEPYLYDHDIFMVDTSATNIVDGERYAIYFEDEPLVKQIFKHAGGELILHSHNPRYPDKRITADKLEFVRVVGRVVYRSG